MFSGSGSGTGGYVGGWPNGKLEMESLLKVSFDHFQGCNPYLNYPSSGASYSQDKPSSAGAGYYNSAAASNWRPGAAAKMEAGANMTWPGAASQLQEYS